MHRVNGACEGWGARTNPAGRVLYSFDLSMALARCVMPLCCAAAPLAACVSAGCHTDGLVVWLGR